MDEIKLPPPKASSSPWLMGCGLIIVAVIVLGGLGLYYGYYQMRAFVADVARVAAVEMVRESQMSTEDQDELIVEIDRMVTGFKDGEVSLAKLHDFFDELQQKGLFDYVELMELNQEHLAPVLESEEAVAAATLQVHRVGHGMADRQLRKHRLDEVLSPYFTPNPYKWDGDEPFVLDDESGPGGDELEPERWEAIEQLTREDALAVVEKLRELADAAGVPDQVEPLHIPTVVREAVDRVLSR